MLRVVGFENYLLSQRLGESISIKLLLDKLHILFRGPLNDLAFPYRARARSIHEHLNRFDRPARIQDCPRSYEIDIQESRALGSM